MKNIFLSAVIVVTATPVFAAEDVNLLSCRVQVYSSPNYYEYDTSIIREAGGDLRGSTSVSRTSLRSSSTDGVDGYASDVEIKKVTLREGLSATSKSDQLNEGERLVSKAMLAELEAAKSEDDDKIVMEIDLKPVRSVTVYRLKDKEDGELKHTIVEAFDASGKKIAAFEISSSQKNAYLCRSK